MTEVYFRLVERRTDRKFAVPMQVSLPTAATWQDFLRLARELSPKAIEDAAKILAGGDSARSDAEYEHLLGLARSDIALIFPMGMNGTDFKIGMDNEADELPAAVAHLGGSLAAAQFSHAWWNSEVGGKTVDPELGVSVAELDSRFVALAAMSYEGDPAAIAKAEVEQAFLDLLDAAEGGDLADALERAREFAVDRGLRAPENAFGR